MIVEERYVTVSKIVGHIILAIIYSTSDYNIFSIVWIHCVDWFSNPGLIHLLHNVWWRTSLIEYSPEKLHVWLQINKENLKQINLCLHSKIMIAQNIIVTKMMAQNLAWKLAIDPHWSVQRALNSRRRSEYLSTC